MPELVPRALRAPQTPGRQTIISLAGELRLEGVAPALIEVLMSATDVDDIRQCIDVLGDIGDPQATNSLSDFLFVFNVSENLIQIARMERVDVMLRLRRVRIILSVNNKNFE